MWHKSFAGVYFCGLAIFCFLWELIFAFRTDWFFLLGIVPWWGTNLRVRPRVKINEK